MPKENGPFLTAMLVVGNANAAAITTDCGDCYRCDRRVGGICVDCVYDENYCGIGEGGLCIGNTKWDSSQGKCVCSQYSVAMCNNPWEFFDNSDDWCDCTEVACISGMYPVGVNDCRECPQPDFELLSCSVHSTVEYAEAMGRYNGCYIPQNCIGKDNSGTFELIADCKYNDELEVVM